jgi:hypothetical protein
MAALQIYSEYSRQAFRVEKLCVVGKPGLRGEGPTLSPESSPAKINIFLLTSFFIVT